MFQLDLLNLIPQSLKQTVRDVLVDFVADQAKKYASDELATKIKKLRSDAAFNKTFEEGLQQAAQRFVEEYKVEDEDLGDCGIDVWMRLKSLDKAVVL